VATDLDIYLLEGSTIQASSEDNNVAGTQMPFEFVTFQNTSASAKTLDLVVGRFSGSATPRVKFIFFGRTGAMSGVEYAGPAAPDATTGTIFGHSGARDAVTVAASRYDDGANPESYSSRGPLSVYFGPVNGTTPAAPLSPPQVLAKPDVTATDGGQTTFFLPPSPYRFFGTSAAAPHAAAVAALMVSRLPTITPGSLGGLLTSTARTMAGGTSRSVGAGLVDALGALGALTLPPPGYNGQIDGVRGVGDQATFRLMQEIGALYNRSRGCTLEPENLSVCAARQP
jgi:hypothetical protein